MIAIAIECMIAGLPEGRYRSLVRQVLERLPAGWDHYRTLGFELSDEKPTRGYASSFRDEEIEGERVPLIDGHHEQCWTVTLYRPWVDQLSDTAVLWVIAHELGHVAAGMACGSLVEGGRPHTRVSVAGDVYREVTADERAAGEKIADAVGRAWGFWLEEEQFEEEAPRLV